MAEDGHRGQSSYAQGRDPNSEDEWTLLQHAGKRKGVNGGARGFGHIEMGVKPQDTSGEMMRKGDKWAEQCRVRIGVSWFGVSSV